MSVKEKYVKHYANADLERQAELQQESAQTINREAQHRLAVARKEELRIEAERMHKQKIRENISKSGIRSMMNEAAHIKGGFVFTELEGEKIITRWIIDIRTGKSVSRWNLFRLLDPNREHYEISAVITENSIRVMDYSFENGDMFNREKIEDAVAKALAHPVVTPSPTPNEPGAPGVVN